MNSLIRGLTWPIITLLIVGGTHLIAEMARPQLQELIGPAVVMPIHLAAGGWAAYATLRAGGTFVHGLIAGAILGVMPFALQLVGFGLILGREPNVTFSLALFGLFTIFWCGALGAGIAASRGGSGSTRETA